MTDDEKKRFEEEQRRTLPGTDPKLAGLGAFARATDVVSAHTPGPWRDRIATGTCDHMISGQGERRGGVCVIPFKYGGGDPGTRNANARLITAAPEQHQVLNLIARGAFLEKLLSLARRFDPEEYAKIQPAVESAQSKMVTVLEKARGK